jgi:hypothetical protein
MIVATDAPLDARQLRRLSLRAGAGLARTGSVYGHGSAISRWRSPRRTPCRIWPTTDAGRAMVHEHGSTRCSAPRPTASSRPSSMRCGMAKPFMAAMGTPAGHCENCCRN